MHGRVHIGTSGWQYAHWKGRFYPDALPKSRYLEHYAIHFRSVEINNSFYRYPRPETLRRWAAAVPEDFLFAVKAPRTITHFHKLKPDYDNYRAFYDALGSLGGHRGPLLYQLPPNFRVNLERLDAFLGALGPGIRPVLEFREPSWYREDTYRLLEHHGAALCIMDLDGHESPERATADFMYVRLHGPQRRYAGSYNAAALDGWAGRVAAWCREGRDVFVYFDNDNKAAAVQDALALQARLSGPALGTLQADGEKPGRQG